MQQDSHREYAVLIGIYPSQAGATCGRFSLGHPATSRTDARGLGSLDLRAGHSSFPSAVRRVKAPTVGATLPPNGAPWDASTPRLGLPIHEAELVERIKSGGRLLMPPGRGRTLIILDEVPFSNGRTDLLMVVASWQALFRLATSAPRFRTEIECHVAADSLLDEVFRPSATAARLRVSEPYVRRIAARVADANTERTIRRDARIVADSCVIEAKMDDWRRALAQASRYRGRAHRIAVALPEQSASNGNRAYFRRRGVGLVSLDAKPISWSLRPRKRGLHIGASLWLAELVRRRLLKLLLDSEAG